MNGREKQSGCGLEVSGGRGYRFISQISSDIT